MHALRRSTAALGAVALTATALTSCGLGSSEYCDALSEDSNSAGQVYQPYIASEAPADWAEPRLDLLEEAGEPDDDLADDYETYLAYLEDMTEMEADQQNDAMMLTADDPEISEAQDALFEDWNTNCEK